MGRRCPRVGLVVLAAALAGEPAGSSVVFEFTLIDTPGASRCADASEPGALGSAIDGLRDAVLGSRCADARSCEQAARGLGQAFDAVCAGETSRALSQAARAVQQLERASLLPAPGSSLQLWTSKLLVAAAAEAGLARDDLDAGIARLCASARSQQGRGLARVDQSLDRADHALAMGPASTALQELGRALQGIESAAKGIASAGSRCWPRACRGAAIGSFHPGAAQNASIELVPVDRGAVALYRVTADATTGFGDTSGTVRLAHQGSSRALAKGELLTAVAPGAVLVDGDLSTQGCLDANGWVASSNVSERLRLDNEVYGRAQLSSSLRFAPGALGFPTLALLPVVPRATRLRVGDEASQTFGVEGTSGPERFRDACTATHRVTIVEELRVEAGSFEAARVDSSLHCGSGEGVDWTTWVASEVGFARFELQTSSASVRFELACFAAGGAPDACPVERLAKRQLRDGEVNPPREAYVYSESDQSLELERIKRSRTLPSPVAPAPGGGSGLVVRTVPDVDRAGLRFEMQGMIVVEGATATQVFVPTLPTDDAEP